MKTAELVKALLDVDEEVFLLHGEINPHPTVVIVDGAAQRGLIDWELLEKLIYDHNEASASALSPNRYKELVYFYEQFKRKWGRQ